jgi:acyl carrier protein
MIKKGAFTFIEGRGPVRPFKGKYAVKTPRVFDLIRAGWERVGLGELPYRPLRIEFELTTKCNDTCPSCGMGALSLQARRTLTNGQIAKLVDQFESIALPSVAITGGEQFVVMRALLAFLKQASGRVEISKLTTNGLWGSRQRCGPTFDHLVSHGLLESRLFVPLLMISIGEQGTSYVCRVIRHAVSEFSDHELNVAVSSLANPADRKHKIYALMELYERLCGEFPHDRVHSTMRVYLKNGRLDDQVPIHRPGVTPVAKWTNHCYDCFAPTVGSYVLPTALMKQNGDLYSCAAFNVPEKLRFGNLFTESAREVIDRVNRSAYVAKIREGGGLKAMQDIVPESVTQSLNVRQLLWILRAANRRVRAAHRRPISGSSALPFVDLASLRQRVTTDAVPETNTIGGSSAMTDKLQVAAALSNALAQTTGRAPAACGNPDLRLQDDLGLDSLALLELVESLEARLDVTVPDEDTGLVQTVGDLLGVLPHLIGQGTQTPERHRSQYR